jgi:hypothetical protein
MTTEKARDLIAEMLPTLCDKYMGQNAGSDGQNVAWEAQRLFDALDALEREQKIRTYQHLLAKVDDVEEELQKAALARNWKLVTVLANAYFAELTRIPSLEMVVLLAVRQKELVENVASMPGVEALISFAHHARGVIECELAAELAAAVEMGRDIPPGMGRPSDPED